MPSAGSEPGQKVGTEESISLIHAVVLNHWWHINLKEQQASYSSGMPRSSVLIYSFWRFLLMTNPKSIDANPIAPNR